MLRIIQGLFFQHKNGAADDAARVDEMVVVELQQNVAALFSEGVAAAPADDVLGALLLVRPDQQCGPVVANNYLGFPH